MLNLDTHILVFTLAGGLSDRELGLIQREQLVIPDMVLWELAKMTQLGRLEMDLESPEFPCPGRPWNIVLDSSTDLA